MVKFIFILSMLILGSQEVLADLRVQENMEADEAISWGPENASGIRLGVAVENAKESYFAGELIRPIFHFRNDTEDSIDFSHPRVVQAVWTKCEAADQNARRVKVSVLQELPWIAGAMGGELGPGQTAAVYGTMIRVGGSDCNDDRGMFQTAIHAESGQQLKLTFQLDTFIAAIPSAKTGELSLALVDPLERASQLIEKLGEWNDDKPFRSRQYMEMASILGSLEPKKRILLMKKWCGDYRHQIIILCRMLFQPPEGETIRRPRLGSPISLDGQFELKDWPSEPISLVNNVPFLVTTGYALGGQPESARVYLSFCLSKNYEWTSESYYVSTQWQLNNALAELKTSRKWSEEAVQVLESQIVEE